MSKEKKNILINLKNSISNYNKIIENFLNQQEIYDIDNQKNYLEYEFPNNSFKDNINRNYTLNCSSDSNVSNDYQENFVYKNKTDSKLVKSQDVGMVSNISTESSTSKSL